jgi:glycosyltransferase involved in cell wall biosynthesis
MRILHATDTYGPTIGGIEVLVRDLAGRQSANGHDATVLTRTPGPDESSSSPVDVVRNPGRMAELVRSADVVHAHVSAFSPLALRAAEQAASRGVPTVAAVHSMWGSAWPLVRAAAAARGWLDAPIQWAAVSEAAAGPVRRALPHRTVIVLPNAIDVAAWVPSAQPAAVDTVTMVAVMRMTRRKRPLALVEVLRQLRQDLPTHVPIRAVLVGDGPQRPAVLRAVARYGLDSWVSVPGAMNHEQIKVLYRTAHIFLSPATLESFGLAALEARASGLAVVARAGTGVVDFVTHEQDGLVAETDDELADELLRLCTDPGLLADFRTHNVSHAPAFDWSDVLWRNEYGYRLAAELAGRPVRIVGGQIPAP